jgi:uncharacterized protein YjbI with pentapeptide repeats
VGSGLTSRGIRSHLSSVLIDESDITGLAVASERLNELRLSDAILCDCDLSNVATRQGSIRRTQLHEARLVGFTFEEGSIRDVTVADSTLALASLARSTLENVVFERAKLSEATFIGAKLKRVWFIDCDLRGTDFREAKMSQCLIRGSTVDELIGVESLRGCSMPLDDIVASAVAFASALGIRVHEAG